MLSVDSECLDSQATFLAPTASDARCQIRDTLCRETLDNQPSRPITSVPRDNFPRQPLCPPYEESSGSAKVQPNPTQLEANRGASE